MQCTDLAGICTSNVCNASNVIVEHTIFHEIIAHLNYKHYTKHVTMSRKKTKLPIKCDSQYQTDLILGKKFSSGSKRLWQ